MNSFPRLAVALLCLAVTSLAFSAEAGAVAPKPLYRDPVFDGAADPVVVWNAANKAWWMFYTNRRANVPGLSGVAWVHGTRIGIAESTDGGATWSRVGDADISLPETVGGQEPTHWAPDIIRVGDRYLLYYSVSSFGKKTSAIALATNATLDPANPSFQWRDEGIVVRSGPTTNFNAIDPALLRDRAGRLWMSFGSYWSGLKLIELDPGTGKPRASDTPLHALAHDRSIEAAFIHERGDQYYLFASYGWCCRGINSTYHLRVGRSAAITGPYVDREGRPMLNGGGTLVAGSEGPFIGPGHASIMTIDHREWFGCHFYDATQAGQPRYALRPLTWDAEGWPVVGKVSSPP